jgi:hypothetical protein
MKKNKVPKQEEDKYAEVPNFKKVKLVFYCYKRDIEYCTESCENACGDCFAN